MVADLNAYLQQLSASNRAGTGSIYGTVGQAINSVPLGFDGSSNPWTIFAGNLAKSLLGSGVSAYGQASNDAYDKATKAAVLNAALAGNPDYTPISTGNRLDAGQLGDIQKNVLGMQLLDKQTTQQGLAAKLAEALASAKGTELGKLQADQDPSVKNSSSNPLFQDAQKDIAAKNAIVTDARDFLKGTKTSQSLETVSPAFQQIVANIGLGTPAAKLAVFNALSHIGDPTGAITSGSFEEAKQALPAVQAKFGDITSALFGDAKLDTATQIAILEAAANQANSYGSQYSTIVNQEKARASKLGADPSLITTIPVQNFHVPAIPEVNAYGDSNGGTGIVPAVVAGAGTPTTARPAIRQVAGVTYKLQPNGNYVAVQ